MHAGRVKRQRGVKKGWEEVNDHAKSRRDAKVSRFVYVFCGFCREFSNTANDLAIDLRAEVNVLREIRSKRVLRRDWKETKVESRKNA